jgi:acyl-CoA hydrolase
MSSPQKFKHLEECADWIMRELKDDLVIAAPLGLGKPNQLLNLIYNRVKSEPKLSLRMFTALSLGIPNQKEELARRFFEPFRKRHWGDDYPELEYLKDLESGGLPANIRLHEFYVQAGKSVNRPESQRDYVSVNYTHAAYSILHHGIRAVVQLVAKNPRDGKLYSLSSNPDLTLDVVDVYRAAGEKLLLVAVVHPDLPYCGADAEVPEVFFDAIVESSEVRHQLFALPRQPISDADYMIGLQASLLIEDGGTLQIGIGSLSEALVHCTLLRHQKPEVYRAITDKLLAARPWTGANELLHRDPFVTGLYGTSEMIMDGFMHLHRAGILKREVFDVGQEVKRYLHGAFFLGSKDFYQWLRDLDSAGDTGLCMTRVSKVNDLYDSNEWAIRRQRVKARFFNSCMGATLLGGAFSDTKENGAVVSGVGGQYNFVAMSHELPDSHSVLMFRAARGDFKHRASNIVWGQGHLTIPRHLRDVMVTEYGIAFLNHRTDQQTVQAMLAICEKDFQGALEEKAKHSLKLDPSFEIRGETNTAVWNREFLRPWREHFPAFPFGSDFTPVEERLATALKKLKAAGTDKRRLAELFFRGWSADADGQKEALERMGLMQPRNLRDRIYKVLLLGAL